MCGRGGEIKAMSPRSRRRSRSWASSARRASCAIPGVTGAPSASFGRSRTNLLGLLEAGLSPDATNAQGQTALGAAIDHCSDTSVISVFAERGTNLDLQDRQGRTPLMHAAARVLTTSSSTSYGAPCRESPCPGPDSPLRQRHRQMLSLSHSEPDCDKMSQPQFWG